MKLLRSSQSLARLERRAQAAFTLLEVMIAIAIFFICTFAILELVSRNLAAARGMQRTLVDPASVAAELSLTNQLTEGSESGDIPDYPGVHWTRDVTEFASNGLYRVDITVYQTVDRHTVESRLSTLMFRPQSVQGAQTGLGNSLGGRR